MKKLIIAIPIILSSCTVIHNSVCLKNCTNDTLYIGMSEYDNLDSVRDQFLPNDLAFIDSVSKTKNIGEWNEKYFRECPIYPDSICWFPKVGMLSHSYIFIIQKQIAKNHTLKDIRKNKLYNRITITKGFACQNVLVNYKGSQESSEVQITGSIDKIDNWMNEKSR